MPSVWSNFRRLLRAFTRARDGNVALTFALAALPIVGSVGAAIDFSHANAVKVSLQSALDSTALMLSRDAATLDKDDLDSKAQAYFKALFNKPEGKNIKISATYATDGGASVRVDGQADVPTTFMGVVGYNTINVTGSATSKWGSTRLRVALVLDTTGSMAQDGKMTALKSSTKSLLGQLQSAAGTDGDVYVSIVPFSKDVNAGSSNVNADWIDWTLWGDTNGQCTASGGGFSRHGGNGASKYTNRSDCEQHNDTWTPSTDHSSWNGCITDRGRPTPIPDGSTDYDQSAIAPDPGVPNSKFPAERFSGCTSEMMGLNYNWTSMKTLVDNLSPNGNTNQPIGLVWGWQSLVGGGPLTAPAMDSDHTYTQAIILLSDGLNTENRWYTSASSIDKRMVDAKTGSGTCANIKAAGITIYTIQVNTGGDPTSTLLKNCASDSDKFFLLTSASQIVTAFNAIGTNLTRLRVAK